jgi:hypothetical protein
MNFLSFLVFLCICIFQVKLYHYYWYVYKGPLALGGMNAVSPRLFIHVTSSGDPAGGCRTPSEENDSE